MSWNTTFQSYSCRTVYKTAWIQTEVRDNHLPRSPITSCNILPQPPPLISVRKGLHCSTPLLFRKVVNGHQQESFGRSSEIEILHLTQQSILHPHHGWTSSSQWKNLMALNFYKTLDFSRFACKPAEQNTCYILGTIQMFPLYHLLKTNNTLAVYTQGKSMGCSIFCIQNILLSTRPLSCEKPFNPSKDEDRLLCITNMFNVKCQSCPEVSKLQILLKLMWFECPFP